MPEQSAGGRGAVDRDSDAVVMIASVDSDAIAFKFQVTDSDTDTSKVAAVDSVAAAAVTQCGECRHQHTQTSFIIMSNKGTPSANVLVVTVSTARPGGGYRDYYDTIIRYYDSHGVITIIRYYVSVIIVS